MRAVHAVTKYNVYLSKRVLCKVQNGGLRGCAGRRELPHGHGEEQVHTSCTGQQENRAAGSQVSHQGRSPPPIRRETSYHHRSPTHRSPHPPCRVYIIHLLCISPTLGVDAATPSPNWPYPVFCRQCAAKCAPNAMA